MERIDFDFEYLYDNRDDLADVVRDDLRDTFDVADLARGLAFDINDAPADLSDASCFLEDVKGEERPSIFEMYEIDHIFANKSHTDVLNMMWFGDEGFSPMDDYFVINAYGNFGKSSNDYEELLEEYMPEAREVLDFAEKVESELSKIVDDVVKEAKIDLIKEFADDNDLTFKRFSDGIELSFESDAGVEVRIPFHFEDVQNFEDLRKLLFDKSNLDIDTYIKDELGVYGGPDIESIINSYDRDDEAWAATFGDDCDYDRAVELRDDAYSVRGKLDELGMKAGEKHRELEKEEEKEQEKDTKKKNKGIGLGD